MKSFLARFAPLVLSVLSGFDRLRFRGLSRLLGNPSGVNSYLYQHDLLIKEFPDHAEDLTRTLVRGTEALAQTDGYPIHYLNSPTTDKEATARQLAQQRNRTQGRLATPRRSVKRFKILNRERGSRPSTRVNSKAENHVWRKGPSHVNILPARARFDSGSRFPAFARHRLGRETERPVHRRR